MFKAGIKKKEYREIKKHWVSRLCIKYSAKVIYIGADLIDKHSGDSFEFKKFDFVQFTNGYSKLSPQITFEFKSIRIGDDFNMDWGGHLMCDEEGYKKKCFIITIGSKVGQLNC